jgi:hypothetical protein
MNNTLNGMKNKQPYLNLSTTMNTVDLKKKAGAALTFCKGKVGAVVAAAGAVTLAASSAMAQVDDLSTSVNTQTTDMLNQAKLMAPGVLAVVGFVTLCYLAYKFIKGSK